MHPKSKENQNKMWASWSDYPTKYSRISHFISVFKYMPLAALTLYGLPAYQNSDARLVFEERKFFHITPLLRAPLQHFYTFEAPSPPLLHFYLFPSPTPHFYCFPSNTTFLSQTGFLIRKLSNYKQSPSQIPRCGHCWPGSIVLRGGGGGGPETLFSPSMNSTIERGLLLFHLPLIDWRIRILAEKTAINSVFSVTLPVYSLLCIWYTWTLNKKHIWVVYEIR